MKPTTILRSTLLTAALSGAAACGYTLQKNDGVAGVQVICYAHDGKPLFQPAIFKEADLSSSPFVLTQESGLRVYVRTGSCLAQELSTADVAALTKKPDGEAAAPTPAPPPPPEKIDPPKHR